MAVQIVVDSTADLPEELRTAWRIHTAPLGVLFGDQLFLEGIDMTLPDFYARLVSSKQLPTTTQVNPQAFAKLFSPIVEAGDQALVLCLSSGLSGTYQSAMIAKADFSPNSIRVVDTRSVTIGAAILVARAVEMRDAGAPIDAIVSELEDMSKRVVVYAIIDDLMYLHKGGRLSGVGMRVGGVLRLKPIVSIWNAVASMAGMTRGMKHAYQWVADRAAHEGIDERYHVAFGDTNAPHLSPALEAVVFPNGHKYRTFRHPVGIVLGTHAGPGAVAMAYVKKKA